MRWSPDAKLTIHVCDSDENSVDEKVLLLLRLRLALRRLRVAKAGLSGGRFLWACARQRPLAAHVGQSRLVKSLRERRRKRKSQGTAYLTDQVPLRCDKVEHPNAR